MINDISSRARFSKDKLYVKGNLQTQFVEPILPHVDPNEVLMDTCTIAESDPVSDAGSEFKGYAANVASLHDVSLARQQLLLRDGVANATHLILAYSFDNDDGVEENFISDRDHGVGMELLKYMRTNDHTNCVLLATRSCSPDFKHLGRKRFDYINETCLEALERL